MPAAPSQTILSALINAFQDAGSAAFPHSTGTGNPRQFTVTSGEHGTDVWVYVWTLTHGGRSNLPNELRIQMTGVESPLQKNASGPTLLLGFHQDTGIFAGFDPDRHTHFTTGSPSVQVSLDCIHQALQNGLAFARKSSDEIVVCFRPEQLANYAAHIAELHRQGPRAELLPLLQQTAQRTDLEEEAVAQIGAAPRRVLATVSRIARAGSFRQQVLAAYENRCAVTRMQLKLIDAAHILPLHADETIDDVRNGIALSPTYHRAFDNALIYLDRSYVMRLNGARANELSTLGLDGGLHAFQAPLNRKVHLPADRKQWPKAEMIRMGNRFRRILEQ